MNDNQIQQLIHAIEQAVGYKVKTPKDFEHLAQRIEFRTREHISTSTLKRLWGYVQGYAATRQTTWDILCRFIGYHDVEHFLSATNNGEQAPSSSTLFEGECLYVDELSKGTLLRLSWAPGRVCDVYYEGDYTFHVVASKLTKLTPDSTFRCYIIEQGKPLYISHLRFNTDQQNLFNYVAGMNGGITFERGSLKPLTSTRFPAAQRNSH